MLHRNRVWVAGIGLFLVLGILGAGCAGGAVSGDPENVGESTEIADVNEGDVFYEARDTSRATPYLLAGQEVSLYPHPRIWIIPERMEQLKARAVTSNPVWGGIDYDVGRKLADGSYQSAAYSGILLNFAMAYLMTERDDYLQAAKTVLLNYTDPAKYNISCNGTTYCGNGNIDFGSMELIYISAAYDWLYDVLTPAERQQLVDWVYDQLIPFLRKHPYTGDKIHNLGHTKWAGEFHWALATVGDDSRADALLEDNYRFWTEQILPILDDAFPGGHTYSGSGYGYNRVFKYQLYGMEAAWTALGLRMHLDHTWPVDEVYYRIHSTLPTETTLHSDWESAEATFNEGRMTENEVILSHRYQGSRAGLMVQHYIQNVYKPRTFYNRGGTRVHPYYTGGWYVWYDPDFAQEDQALTQPSSYVADGLGLFMSRSDWNDPSALWFGLSASKYVGDHQLHNEGSFKIFKHEYLVVENGPYYAGQESNTTPPSTNILFVGDGKVQYGEVTGGLYRRTQGSQANIAKQVADNAARFSYALADLGSAYEPSYFRMEHFHRNIVHLKPFDGTSFDYVILFDRVQSVNAESKKIYVHLVESPTINGSVADVLSTNNKSRLFAHDLLPESTTVSAESIANKTTGSLTQETQDNPTRLVFTKTSGPATGDHFLVGFAVTDDLGVASPSLSRIESADGLWIGAFVPDGAMKRSVLFSRSPSASGAVITYTVPESGATQHLIFDLPASAKYSVSFSNDGGGRNVTVTPDPAGTFQANEQGVLVLQDS